MLGQEAQAQRGDRREEAHVSRWRRPPRTSGVLHGSYFPAHQPYQPGEGLAPGMTGPRPPSSLVALLKRGLTVGNSHVRHPSPTKA